jgi:DHA2 family multidrug resistance protein-like MFS transporter
MSRRLEVLSVAAVVAAASADSSIVALALPQLYGRFHTTVVGVSWVLTAYNAVVAVTAVALLALGVSLRGRLPYAFGVALFLAASAACAFAGDLTFLIAPRSCSPVRSACCARSAALGSGRSASGRSPQEWGWPQARRSAAC